MTAAVAAATMTTLTAVAALVAVRAGGRDGLGGRAAEERLEPAEEAAGFRRGRRGRSRIGLGGRGALLAVLTGRATVVGRGRHVIVAGAHVEELLRDGGGIERGAFLPGRTLGAFLATGFVTAWFLTARTIVAGRAG